MKKFFLLITLLGLMLSAMAQVNLQNDLIGYFPFSGNISDTTGTFTSPNNTAITYGDDRNSTASSAIVLDGTNATVTELGTQLDATATFSVSLWFNRATIGTRQILVAKYADTSCGENNRQFFVEIQANDKLGVNVQGTTSAGSANYWDGSSDLSATGVWNHLTLLYSPSGTIEAYIDGVKETLTNTVNAADKAIAAGSAPLSVGGSISAARDCQILPFNGSIDDVAVYNRLLNPLEILSLAEVEFFILSSVDPASQSTVDQTENFTLTFNQAVGTPASGDITVMSKLKGKLSPTISTSGNEVSFTLSNLEAGDDLSISIKNTLLDASGNISFYESNVLSYKVSSEGYEQPPVFTYPAETLFAGSGTDYLDTKTVDFDLDGDIDIAATSSAGFLGFFVNDGFGGFTRTSLTNSFSAGTSVDVGDLDNDGDLDLIATRTNQISYYINDGAGSYTLGLITYLGTGYAQLADLDGDGDLDIVAYTQATSAGNVSYFLNNGDATFGTQVVIVTGLTGLNSMDIGDVDGDYDLDIIVVDQGSDPARGVRLIKNNGGLSFSSSMVKQLLYQFGSYPNGIAHTCKLADLNGDGALDLAWVSRANNTSTSKLFWWPNDGLGGFGTSIEYNIIQTFTGATSNSSINLNTADIDADGDQDIVVSMRQTLNRSYLFVNQNNGQSFAEQLLGFEYPTSTAYVNPPDFADMNGDGVLDIVMASAGDIKLFEQRDLLTLVSSSPSNGDIDVDNESDITLTFDKDVNQNTVAANILVRNVSNSNETLTYTYSLAGNVLTINPDQILPSNAQIQVIIGNLLTSADGSDITNGVGFMFTSFGLRSTASYPAQGQSMVKNDTTIVIDFNRDISSNSVDDTSFRVSSAFRPSISGTYDVSGSRVTFTPDEAFWSNENVKVELTKSIESTSGLLLTKHHYFEFFAGSAATAENAMTFDRIRLGTYLNGQTTGLAIPFDRDNDGDMDFTYNIQSNGQWKYAENTNGTGTYTINTEYTKIVGNNDFFGMVEDIDKDGIFDFYSVSTFASLHQHRYSASVTNNSSTSSVLSQGTNGANTYASMDISDYDNDGDKDIIWMNETNSPIVALQSDNSGTLAWSLGSTGVSTTRGIWLKMFDMNMDGYDDLMLTDYKSGTNAEFQYYTNDQNGAFVFDTSFVIPNAVYFEPYDIDLDGDMDIVLTNNVRNEFNIFVNDGNMNFTKQTITNTDINTHGGLLFFAIGDMNLDGFPDIVYESLNLNEVNILLNDGTGLAYTFALGNSATLTGELVNARFISLADMDKDGDLDIYFTEIAASSGSTTYQPAVILENKIINASEPPVVIGSIANVVFDEDNTSDITVNLASLFSDPESDPLTYTVSSSEPKVQVSLAFNNTIIRLIPDANFNGAATITLSASDGVGSASTTFTATVTAVNDAPTGVDFTIDMLEDNSHFFNQTEFIINDVDSPLQSLAQLEITTLSSNGTLKFNGSPVTAGSGITGIQLGQLEYTPLENENGSTYSTFTFRVSDGLLYSSAANTVTIKVTAVNDAPEFALSGNVSVPKNFSSTETVTVTDASPANESDQTITYSINPATISFANMAFSSSTGIASFTSVADAFGNQEFTVTANDGEAENNTFSSSFTFSVLENLPPVVVAGLGNADINEDSPTNTIVNNIANVFSDPENDALTYSISDDFGGNVTVNLVGVAIQVTPSPNYYGSGTITVTAADANQSVSSTFTLTVNSVNDAPVLDNFIPEQTAVEDEFYSFTIPANTFSDVDGDNLTISVSGQPAWLIFDAQTLTLSGTPANENVGSFVLNVSAVDSQFSSNQGVNFIVVNVNDLPQIISQPTLTFDEDGAALTIDLTTLFSDDDGDVLTFTLAAPKSEGPAIITATIVGNILTVTPVADANGTMTLGIMANDGSLESGINYDLPVSITSVNDAPAFSLSEDQISLEQDFAGTQTVTIVAGAVPFNETEQTVTYTITPNDGSLVNINISGEFINITTVAGASGTATFTITASENSEVNGTFTQTLTITINKPLALNDDLALSIFPNPATDFVMVQSKVTLNISIFNLNGSLMRTGESNQLIEVYDLESGVYLIQTKDENRKSTIDKLIIK